MVNANCIYMIFYSQTLATLQSPPHSISLCSTTNPPSSSSSTLVITWEMETMEAKALKSSFRLKLAAKSTHPAILEDSSTYNGTNAGSGEDFAVEEFFNFSNGDLEQWSSAEGEEEEESEKDRLSVSSLDPVDDSNPNPDSFSAAGDEDSLLSELAVPGDDLAALEWVSHFVDDSLLEFSLLQPAVKTKSQTRSEVESRPIVSGVSCLSSSIPAKPRTKKARTSSRVWSGSLLTESLSSSSSSSVFTGAPCLFFTNSGQDMENRHAAAELLAKKQQKKSADEASGSASETQLQRRCSHCQVQKTPQWRTGPLGAKTLCNACGVRYKSGRLFPEYRPACSPTFAGDIHSNSHRKVLELRKRKDIDAPASGFGRMVPSF